MIGETGPSGQWIGLRVPDLALTVGTGEDFALTGKTLAQAMGWADHRFGTATGMHARDYDMPTSPLKSGDRFMGYTAALAELARWYDLGLAALTRITGAATLPTTIRIWPHHFDMGTILYLDASGENRQIGVGLSPGDGSYAEPYFYVTPYPIAKDATFGALPSGTWHREGWTGAVLTGTQIVAGADPHEFLRAAVDAARAVIA